jgi:hydrogenase-4 component F
MTNLLVALVVLPLAGAASALLPGRRLAPGVSVVVALACLVLGVMLIPVGARGPVQIGFLRADAISVVFVLTATFVYASSTVYAVGYLQGERHRVNFSGYARRFWAGINLFAWS